MGDLSDLLENEKIDWPPELKPISLVRGSNQIGDTWKVEFNTLNLISQLQTELNKRKKQLRQFENRHEELNISNNYETDDIRIYDSDGEMSQLDVLITKLRNRIQHIEMELDNLTNKYDMSQSKPKKGHFNTARKGKQKKRTKEDEEEEEEEQNDPSQMSCYAKLLMNPFIIRNNKSINKKHTTNTLDEQLNSLISELQSIKDCLNSYNNDSRREEEEASIECYYMNMILIDKIMRSTDPFTETYSVMYLTKGVVNGSVTDYLKNLPNRNNIYQVQDKLLYKNLAEHIRLLSHMERYNLSHNNIKPSNVLISDDGSRLMLTDFCPFSLFVEKCYKIYSRRLATRSKSLSPELKILLTNEMAYNNMDMSKILTGKIHKKVYKMDFTDKIKTFIYKNDIFCLGLVYYYLLTLKIPDDESIYYDDMIEELKNMTVSRNKEMIGLVIRMLEYDSFTRESWTELFESVEDVE